MKIKFLFVFCALLLINPLNALAADKTYDLGLTSSDISFSKELVVGQKIRIYAGVHNFGTEDVAGYVTFYQGDLLIGSSQVVSVRAGGLVDEVYVDWTVPSGTFNIRAEIKGQDPKDENTANDLTVTSFYLPLPDNDQDSIPDIRDPDDDNDGLTDEIEAKRQTDPFDADSDDDGCLDNADDFPLDPKLCIDSDNDGIDDKIDTDDDNDGLSDSKEEQLGTNPKNPDTDGDGVIDGQDVYPLDPNRSKKAVPVVINNSNKNTNLNSNINAQENINSNINAATETPIEEDLNQNINAEINLGNLAANNLNPQVDISISQKDWRTYIFRSQIRGLNDENLAYHWEFGDGSYSTDKIAEHSYEGSGDYKVSLKISGKNDLELTADKQIEISFFNFGNFTLWLILGGLMMLLLILLFYLISKRKQKHYASK
ncbi:MAG: hypothetical protein A2Y67_00835 [Candidatus Buchananbacteria bacterium RBG_13_39_9]|uniref:PKD domain-containing protein n=1 Tax=Candidatus Buchananbacteria bacterium RBG_13_39_9 TaxID=1797531 RepID=A0A1G1XMD3_9BACT|nr:MAG: hypothetical protein A2Y67_00835 [Candidatus Buchananbacteria bacterium RBG_13_39_9]